MDSIVIPKMGIEIIKYTRKGHNRSIYIDITEYRDEVMCVHRNLSYLLTTLAPTLAINGDIRIFLWEYSHQIIKYIFFCGNTYFF
jgi:hypothetical protein